MTQLLALEVVLPLFLVGVILAFVIGRRTGGGATRLRELEGALDEEKGARTKAEADLDEYRGRVANHFEQTSEQLHDLTLQYRSVYDHLARGASDLCPEGFHALSGGLGLDALPEEAIAVGPTPAAEGIGEELEVDSSNAESAAQPLSDGGDAEPVREASEAPEPTQPDDAPDSSLAADASSDGSDEADDEATEERPAI